VVADVERGDIRADVLKLKLAAPAPLEELQDGAAVGLACVLIGDLCDKELHELPLGLLAGGLDNRRELQAALGQLLAAIVGVRLCEVGAHRCEAVGRT